MKTDIASTIQTLSTNATIIGANGLIASTGITVQLVTEPYASEYNSRYIIGRTEHIAQDIVHEGDEMHSLAAGWTVRLNTISQAAAAMGRKGRAVNSEAQKAAAAKNGKKGGRPPNEWWVISTGRSAGTYAVLARKKQRRKPQNS